MRRSQGFLFVAGMFALATMAYAQLPPAAEVLPAGFKLLAETDTGGTKIIEATKPNESFPKGHQDEGIKLQIMWQNSPMVDMILDMVAKQPEDPAAQSPGTGIWTEPCGKQAYQGGILKCVKNTRPYIGTGNADPLVTWDVGWTGKGKDGIVGVGVTFLYGNKEAAMAWIDAIIPKITKVD